MLVSSFLFGQVKAPAAGAQSTSTILFRRFLLAFRDQDYRNDHSEDSGTESPEVDAYLSKWGL